MTQLQQLNIEIIEKLHQLELAHKHCVDFMGKAFLEESRDRLDSGIYFHKDFIKKSTELNKLITKQKELLPPEKSLKYEM
jgi:hypothetical protein